MRNMWKNTDSKVLMEQKREYNNSFDLVKFWCSYIVISIHCGLRNDIIPNRESRTIYGSTHLLCNIGLSVGM